MTSEQKEVYFKKYSIDEAKEQDFPTFNGCNHYHVDMSHLDPRTGDWMNTIVVSLPNGNHVTFCVMQTSKDESCIDTVFHGENVKDSKVYAMGGEGKDADIYNKDIYALIAHSNEVL